MFNLQGDFNRMTYNFLWRYSSFNPICIVFDNWKDNSHWKFILREIGWNSSLMKIFRFL